ncbi:MAG: hypothetical protein PHS54_04585, partial [Clostridia bacterium]|nr:hypothetical protein [Clostridia bacterium]
GNIFTQKIQMDSVDYIRELSAEVVRGNGEDVLTEDNTYLLYFVENESQKEIADADGYYNNYLVNIFTVNGSLTIDQLNISSNNEVVNISTENDTLKVFANTIGETSILIEAKDGSGRFVELNFKVIKIEPTRLEINEHDILSTDFQTEDFENAIGEISFYIPNGMGLPTNEEIDILIENIYVDPCIIRFETELDITIEETIQGNLILRKYFFEEQNAGNYNVDLIIDGEVVYSFNIEVLGITPYFSYGTEDNNNIVEYNFNKCEIIVTSLENQERIYFVCGVFDAWGEISQQLSVSIKEDINNCVEDYDGRSGLETIFFKVKSVGEFTFTITDAISNISVDFRVIISA